MEKLRDTELVGMVKAANDIVENIKPSVGYPGWWSQLHLFSMIAAISTAFMIKADTDLLHAIIHAANDIGTAKYKAVMKLLWFVKPGQMAVFNGVLFPEAARMRAKALGSAYTELCKAVKQRRLNASEMGTDMGINILLT